jgi:hypothetical protein
LLHQKIGAKLGGHEVAFLEEKNYLRKRVLLNLIWLKVVFMAWHIIFFYKSLRILEEFRKSPFVQIPSKSPYINSQSLAKISKVFEIQNYIFL